LSSYSASPRRTRLPGCTRKLGFRPHGIGAEQGHLVARRAGFDHLLRGTGQRQIQPAANPVQ
jgi:hypothetical protein